jgi:hypothetical protein
MQRSRGRKSPVVGAIVVLWVVFAVGDYYASIVSAHPSIALDEALAVQRLRILSTAEASFANVGSAAEPVYGSVADLVQAGLIDSSFKAGQVQLGYRLGQVVEAPKWQFLFFASPVQIQPSFGLLPAASKSRSRAKNSFGGKNCSELLALNPDLLTAR